MAVEYLGTGNDDGVNFGRSSTDKIGFWGLTTPIVRPVLTPSQTATATTTINERRLNSIQTMLVNMGLCATA